MSATSKRDRALQTGAEPVTDKSIHMGDEPMPEYLDVDMAAMPVEDELPEEKPKKKARKKTEESDDG